MLRNVDTYDVNIKSLLHIYKKSISISGQAEISKKAVVNAFGEGVLFVDEPLTVLEVG